VARQSSPPSSTSRSRAGFLLPVFAGLALAACVAGIYLWLPHGFRELPAWQQKLAALGFAVAAVAAYLAATPRPLVFSEAQRSAEEIAEAVPKPEVELPDAAAAIGD